MTRDTPMKHSPLPWRIIETFDYGLCIEPHMTKPPPNPPGRKPSPFGRSVRVYVPILLREEFRAWLRERIGLDSKGKGKVK